MEVIPTFIECQSFASEHGYEPQTDYRKKTSLQSPVTNIWADRKGTVIHADFQKKASEHFLHITVMPLRTRREAKLG